LRRQRVEAFALQEVHAVEAEGFYFYEGLRGADFGDGSVGINEHVLDGAFAALDVWEGRLERWFLSSLPYVCFCESGGFELTNCTHGRHIELFNARMYVSLLAGGCNLKSMLEGED
jgi:hypothetical protein